MADYTVDPDQISKGKLQDLYDAIQVAAKSGSDGEIQMTALLSIVSSPADVAARIKQARGPVKITECRTTGPKEHKCKGINTGKKVEEDTPGTGSFIGTPVTPGCDTSWEGGGSRPPNPRIGARDRELLRTTSPAHRQRAPVAR